MRSTIRHRLSVCVLLASLLVAGACGAGDTFNGDTAGQQASDTEAPTTAPVTTAPPTTAPPTTAPPTAPPTTAPATSAPATTDDSVLGAPATTTTIDDGLPGEPLDLGPAAGTDLAVVGVRYDDVLHLRSLPDPSSMVIATAAPLVENDLDAAGEARLLPSSVWWKVFVGGQEAWANQSFLGMLGRTDDIFSDVAQELLVLKAETVEEMALLVASTRGGGGPEPTVTFAGEPLAFHGVGGFAIIDVLGYGDDALKGERIRIDVDLAYDANNENVEFVVLSGVERTLICGRGVTGDGACV